jgi:hypothetical protein
VVAIARKRASRGPRRGGAGDGGEGDDADDPAHHEFQSIRGEVAQLRVRGARGFPEGSVPEVVGTELWDGSD